ncbi:MAG: DNA-directed RNA polymerase subunit alpha [Anaerolineae bacterium]|nr:DNA-directed RNA polymerase subunit alpha [Anaerolineae bacterium]
MSNLVLPRIETVASSRNYGRFHIGPLESGYGITLGNALRRVLLSSLPGAAVTYVRVSGVPHEFTTIPHVKEDMMAFILNVKKLRLKLDGDEDVRLRLSVRGQGVVTAADLECPPNVEVANPDLYLLTADSDEADLDIELVVSPGRGYSPAEERVRTGNIGEIAVDAIFSPVRKVNYEVERTRIGQATDYDRLMMEIWTDGTISPEEALSSAAKILVEHFLLVSNLGREPEPAEEAVEPEAAYAIPPDVAETVVEELGLSVRAYNCLKRAGITKVGQILERLQKGRDELLSIRNFGEKSLEELLAKLEEKGFLEGVEIPEEEG